VDYALVDIDLARASHFLKLARNDATEGEDLRIAGWGWKMGSTAAKHSYISGSGYRQMAAMGGRVDEVS
jgi:hypothetical protein